MDPFDPRMPDNLDPTSADAEWKKIQQNTFTRWCNEHLKCVNQFIYNLETDLCDGLKLIALLQVLSHKKVPRHTKKPVFKSQKIENVSIALKFIEDQNIRLVNIDASDIVKGNLKLILGLIWTLILKYQISMPYMEEEEEGGTKMTPKQALLAWVKSKMPESVPMDNFSNHWNDGRAIACLVDAVAPGLLPECEDLDPKDSLENAQNAMKLAEDWLGVPQVLRPEDMINPKVDELSVMTYVSYFPEAKLKPGAPLKPRVHPSTKVTAKGPGVEPKGLVVNQPANFTVLSQGAGLGKLGVKVFSPSKEEVEVFVTDNGDHTYSCQYFPTTIGKYDVHVKWNGRHIPKSPFRVQVDSDLDAKKAYATGPGLEPSGIVAGKYTDFRVFTKGAGEGKVTVKVIDPRGGEDVDVIIEEQENSEYFVEYQPVNAGKHTIKVMFGGQPIKGSPFHVNVAPPRVEPVPGRVRVYGAGVEPTGLKAGYRAPFTVDAKGAGDGELDVIVEGPNGPEKVDIKSHADGTFSCVYFPQKFGKYVVTVTWSGVQVPNSPFNVKVSPAVDAKKIRAYGPGLESGVVGKPAHFTVETKGAGVDSLGFAIEGPSQAEIKCVDKGDGICDVTYFPTQPGKYAVHVTCGDDDIQNSPFMVPISPPGDASLCYAEGPGLEPEGVVTGAPAEFTVFTKQEPDQGDVEVEVVDSKGKKAPCQVTDNKDGTYSVVYHPTATGKYTITVTFNGKQIPKSPFKVNVCQTNSAKCKAYGPGLEKGFVGQSNDFKIETKGAGEGGLGLTIEGPSEAKIECKDNGDGSCDVHYWPTDPGDYNINILYADKHIPGSPFKAKIKYPFDASKVKVEGPGIEPGVRADEPADIDVDTRYAGEAELTVEVLDDLNKPVKVEVDDEEDGINPVAYYPKKQGPHKINIKYGGVHVPGSPFKVKVGPRSEPGKVKVAGPGIEPKGVKAGQPTWFTIDTEKAGKGDIHVGVEPDGRGAKPVEKITVTEESKDHYKCEYVAPVDGPYKVDVKFDGKPVQGSPYKIKVAKGHDASKCKAQGDGLESAIIDQLAEFDVDCSKAGDAPLTATMKNPSGAKTETLVTDNDDGTYAVSYTPVEEGPHTLDVKYGGDHIPGSPFKVNVQPPTDSTKCKAYGPGLEHAFVGKPADFTVETRGAGAGGLSLAVEGPSEAKLTCTDNGDGTCSVRYVPVEVGDYDIHIKFADEHIPGSPFTAKVTRPVDASKVKCYGPGIDKSAPLYSKAPQEFTVDTSEAGDAPLDVKVTPPTGPAREPDEIKQVGDGVYAVKYTPEDEGRYQVNVKYGDKEVPHSPFRVRVGPPYDASKVKVSGPGVEEAIVDEPAEFLCDCSEAGVAPLSATVTPPGGGNPVPCVIKEHGDGKYTCGWNPDVPGRHNVDVKYGDRRVPKSPFRVNVKPSGDASKVKVKGLGPDDRPIIGKENDFLVDARDAGKGKPTCTMKTPNKKEVPVEVLDNGDQTFTCKYVPTEEGRHPVDVKFGGDTVPGSPFYVKPKHGKDVSKIKCAPKDDQKPVVEEEVCYEVDAKPIESTPGEGIVTGALTTPDGDRVPVQVKNNKDGTYDVLSTPKQPGPHKLDVKYDDIPIPGSPFKYDAVEGGPDRVKCFGPGLEKGLVHEPCEFTVVTKSAGPGGLSLAIEGPSKAEIICTDNGDGSCNVKYVPDEPGDYHIIIKYADQHVPGSPFIAKIYSSPDELDSAKPRPTVGKPCDVGLDKIPERDRERIKASLKRPNKKDEEPLPLHFSDDGSPVVSFTPNEPGEHLIHLRKFGRDIENSPFSVLVGDQEEEIISPDIEEGVQTMPDFPEDDAGPKVGKPLDVAFDTPEEFLPRDLKNLTAALKRPNSKREEPVDVFLDKGKPVVTFTPKEPGKHLIHVRKYGRDIDNSPFTVMVGESEDEIRPTVSKPCDKPIDLPGVKTPEDLKKLKATLKRPSSDKEEPVDLSIGKDGSPIVKFTPRETGKHLLHVRDLRNREIPGSPFPIMVYDEDVMSQPKVGEPCDVILDLPDTDIENLEATLKRPHSDREEPIPLRLENGKPVVSFTPREPGKHLIHVRKFGFDIENSPFTVMVGEEEDEIRPTVNRPCDAALDLPGVKSPEDLKKLKATIKRPSSNKEEPADLHMNKNGQPEVTFTPRETGMHMLHVRDNRGDIGGSPFPIMVGEEDVKSKPTSNQPCDVPLDIPDVKSPRDLEKLKATLIRPNSNREEPVDLRLADDGSPIVSFTPTEPGKHLVHVRKYGRDIPNSPFTVMVREGEDEILPTVNRPCDSALDLPGIKSPEDLKKLKATIKRPSSDKEEPADLHMNKNGQPEVTFTPRETGMHMLHVRDNRGDIGGSPFPIMVGEEDVKSKPTSNQPCDVPLDIPDVKSPRDLEKLKATLIRPNSNREEPVDLRLADDGSPIVSFTPTEPGKHLVHVRKYGRDVQNSPFTVMVQTPRLGDVYSVGHTCDVAIDAPGINLPEDLPKMTATLRRPGSNLEEPVKLKINPDNTLGVSFIPRQPGEYFLTVKKSDRQIPGSPFSILVEAEEPIEAVGCPVDYCFDIPEIDLNEDFDKLEATIKRPSSDKEEPIFLKHNSDDTLSCSFVPKEVGIHQINIRKFGRHVKGSPFAVKVTTPEAVSEVDRPYGMGLDIPGINLPDDFSLLSATLKRPSSPKEEELRLLLNGDNTLGVAFTPREVGEHLIHVRKNGIDVKGSPFSVMVVGKEKVEEVHPVGRTCDVGLNIPGVNLPEDFKKLTASLMRPSSKKEEPLNLELNPDNTLGLSFVPREQGEHKISVKKNREDVPGSPFSIMVEAAEAVNAVGKPCERTLDIPGIKPQDLPILKATLKRPSGDKEEPVKVKANSDNSLSVSFVPREQGEHFISVKKYGKHVRGSPFSVMVTEPEADNSIGRPCGVGLEIPGLKLPEDFNLLTGTLKRPNSSQEEPLKLILNSDNTLSVSFVPQETGEHLVSVMKNKQHVTGSPFSVMVSGPGPANPKKVKCYGPGLRTGVADKPAKFTVNTRDAGYGGLGLSIEGPSKAEINCVDNEDGTCDVDYLPTEPGKYTINVKFADEHVPGSPFTAMIKPQGSVVDEGIVPERTSEVFEDLVSFGSPEAQPHDFVFDLKGYDVKDLKVTVISPKGEILDSEILETGENTYTIRFIPKESGEYTVNVKHRGVHIPGSPFKVYVEAPAWGGASKCFAAGPGLERGVVGHPGQFTVWTRDAGPGGLAVAVEGPAKAEIQCKDNGDGSCDITYLPTAPGEYTIHIRFADENIPDSPYKVYVYPEVEDRFRDVNVSDLSETGLKVGQPASFSVQTNAPVGKVTASVIAPSGSETPATVADLGNGNFAIRFIPREFGDHLVNVRFDSSHIPGSPFKIRVGGAEGHPEKVKAYGPGLSSGTAGQPAEFTVNALEAGSGALALSVDGPAKVKMNCTENPDGTYQVTYHPVIAGDYTISIKFAGQHIPGSPYNVKIYPSSGKSPYSDGDASKCTSRGAGLTRAVIGQPNTFTVNASNAGRGSLMVGVEGPAIPAKEITVKHTGGNVYAVNYALEESGAYILKVLWADKHIPGSPFHVTV